MVVDFQALARREPVDHGATQDHLTGAWADRFEAETEKLAEAWAGSSALDGVSAGMGLPQAVVARMATLDLTVHSWDLARATGQEHHPDPRVVADLLATFSDEMADLARRTGAFGDPVEVAEDAPAFDRLLGTTGRDPAWRP